MPRSQEQEGGGFLAIRGRQGGTGEKGVSGVKVFGVGIIG